MNSLYRKAYNKKNSKDYNSYSKDVFFVYFDKIDSKKTIEEFEIASNRSLEKTKRKKLEDEYSIRANKILYGETTIPIPSLKSTI